MVSRVGSNINEDKSTPTALQCTVQHYEWGMLGNESLVAKIHQNNCRVAEMDLEKPYAELWMGSHNSGPSFVLDEEGQKGSSLKEHLGNNDLPFLFKILSVRTALSIQAHPDLALAQILHARDPKNYRDANHKPEMTIAVTEFEALCGFRPVEEIQRFALQFPAFGALLRNSQAAPCEFNLQSAFTSLMKQEKMSISQAIEEMPKAAEDSNDSMLLSLFWKLNSQYPGDVGVFCVFFLNHLILQPGQAMFLAANEPHAYLRGNCIECMATSDNVVRAGLTPKHRDVETLCSMLTYRSFQGEKDLLLSPKTSAHRPAVQLYSAPVPEFSVIRIELNGDGAVDTNVNEADGFGRSILLCLQGSADLEILNHGSRVINLELGSVVYLPSACKYSIKSKSASTIIYQAFKPL